MEILALIPARGGSKSIPQKNLALLAGKPLIAYSIEVALASSLVTRVVVSTDDAEIAQTARDLGAQVPFMRPAELAQDNTPDLPVFQHALAWLAEQEGYQPELVVQLRPTSPLRRVRYVDEAVRLLLDDPQADSVRAVAPPCLTPYKMWKVDQGAPYLEPILQVPGLAEPFNAPRQSLPVIWAQTGLVEVIRPATILAKNSMTGQRILPYYLEAVPMLDIDEPMDLKWGEFLLSHDRY